jgi:curved DNA-binding protein CbpA
MNNYYQILGVDKNATNQDIEYMYSLLKNSNHIDDKKAEAYAILSDYHKRRKYDELLEKKNRFSLFKIPFFGYDFDESYVYKYSLNDNKKIIETNSEENKKYKIDENKYLIYEKKNLNGIIIKNYYIEIDGKRELIPESKINKIKIAYYEKNQTS